MGRKLLREMSIRFPQRVDQWEVTFTFSERVRLRRGVVIEIML